MPGTTDTVKAMLTPGEFVIRKEAVDMIGVPILEKLNDMPEAGGHSEIDRLIAMATLKNMTGMYGGGMVNAKQYMGGGMVNEYKHGGKVHNNLKPIPKNNPGLAKLPEAVRNKMGYMQDGGSVDDTLTPEDLAFMNLGQEAFKSVGDKLFQTKKLYPNLPGATVDSYLSPEIVFGENYQNMSPEELNEAAFNFRQMMDRFKAIATPEVGEFSPLGSPSGRQRQFSENDAEALDVLMFMLTDPDKKYYKDGDSFKRLFEAQYLPDKDKRRLVREFDVNSVGLMKGGKVEDSLMGMMYGGMAKKKKKYGYQEGGAVQDSSMMMQPSPFIPFDQRPNQNPASGYWGEPGAYYNALKDSLEAERKELVADTARNSLDMLIILDSLKQLPGGRIERSPSEPFFFPNTPVQENFMQKYKEEMIDPTYFPEGN